MSRVTDTHYILGSVVGPHPFPMIVRDFQTVIGKETKQQCRETFGRFIVDEVRLSYSVSRKGGGEKARELIEACECEAGCPSCVGAPGEVGEKAKEVASALAATAEAASPAEPENAA